VLRDPAMSDDVQSPAFQAPDGVAGRGSDGAAARRFAVSAARLLQDWKAAHAPAVAYLDARPLPAHHREPLAPRAPARAAPAAGAGCRAGRPRAVRPTAPPATPPPSVDARRTPAPPAAPGARAHPHHRRQRLHGERAAQPRDDVARARHRRLLRGTLRLDLDRV